MARLFLQEMVEPIRLDALPIQWNSFDFATFSRTKRLWDHQQRALENAIKVLWKYFEGLENYQVNEGPEVNLERKRRLFQWYRENGLKDSLDIGLSRLNRKVSQLLEEHYETDREKILYEHFVNRACFWMATGSGKTLVLVKLIELLWSLICRGEIPPHDILVLTHRDDLIEQLKSHVHEFNAARGDVCIHLRGLREFADAKRDHPSLFKARDLTVFYYRSDNLSDDQKERIIDFRNYDDAGKWYLLLDEAHKGDKEESKRQHIYAILSRSGFVFNFSATFTDQRDLATTVFNFNLREFIRAGHGKHIAILRQETRAFGDDEDYDNSEKQKVVLKSLIMLAYARKFSEGVRNLDPGLYHRPLLLTLVNSVNTEDADLKLFFRELERFGKGDIGAEVWQAAKDELWSEFKERPAFMFEDDGVEIDEGILKGLSPEDVLASVYNADSMGDIEVLVRPSNRQELAFKLKTSDRPFALIKIGDISGWLKEELAGYEVNERFEDEGYFERVNASESEINILLGSRSFYEGWDSNRPNVINFINIGTGTDAKKFILQSVGRGVRIEPLKDKRKRLLSLYNAAPSEVEEDLFQQLRDKVIPLETLLIFGTNRSALQTVIEHLDREQSAEHWQQLSLFRNERAEQHKLLIPVYRRADRPLVEERNLSKFEVKSDELDLLERYVDFIQDDRVLVALYDAQPKRIEVLRQSLADPHRFYATNGRSFRNIDLLVRQVFDYFGVIPHEVDRLKELGEEIRHFREIKVSLRDINDLRTRIERVRQFQDPMGRKAELKKKFELGQITLDQYTEEIEELTTMVREEQAAYEGKTLRIRHVAHHYYIPLILGEDEKTDYIKHIIRTPSEVKFVNDLETFLEGGGDFKQFDWWLFSKLDESLDEVGVPYYNPKANAISQFKPDFIFWFQRGEKYYIAFVDPKGTEYADYQHKIDGYRRLFEEGDRKSRILAHDGLNVRVLAFLYTQDAGKVSEAYRAYWIDGIETFARRLEGAPQGLPVELSGGP